MKAEELMIGDWVAYKNDFVQVRQLGIWGEDRDGNDYPAVCVGKPKGIGLIVEHSEIDPIPLTPEILETNGFYYHNQDRWFPSPLYVFSPNINEFIEIHIHKQSVSGVKFVTKIETKSSHENGINTVHSCDVEYVHQLQHALRLCGMKKEIKL